MKQNVLKTLAFTIAMVCVGSLYGQTTRTFQRITSMAELTDGNYLIVGLATVNNTDFYYAMGNMYEYNTYMARRAKELTGESISSNITPTLASSTGDSKNPISIRITKSEDKYTLYDNTSQKYITQTGDDFDTSSPLTENCYATIRIGSSGFIIEYSENRCIAFSYNASSFVNTPSYPRFRISTASNLYLYKEISDTYTYTRDITTTNIGTICLPYSFNVSGNTDAKFYEIEGCIKENEVIKELVLSQVNTLQAGYPYIFKPEKETTLTLTYTGSDAPITTARDKNGLHGTLKEIQEMSGTGVYLVKGGEIRLCNESGTFNLNANRAYIVMSEVPTYDPSQPHAKAILRVPIDDSSTGIEEVAGSEAQPMEYHSVNGTKLSAPQKGLNIVKMSDGSTQKVFVP